MSAEATGWVWKHSPFTGHTKLVHLAVADSVNDAHGNSFWMSVPNLAKKASIDERTARRALRTLTDSGFLAVIADRPGQTKLYRFLFPEVGTFLQGDHQRPPNPKEKIPNTEPVYDGSTVSACDDSPRVTVKTQRYSDLGAILREAKKATTME